MGIFYHPQSRTFHLQNAHFSTIFCILQNGQLGQLYTGKAIRDREDFSHLLELGVHDMAPCTYPGNRVFSLEYLKQEYPTYGSGDLRHPAYAITQENGSQVTDFVYESHGIFPGKPKLSGLPATYTEENGEAETLEITLRDRLLNTRMILSYTVYTALPVLCRNVRFVNDGDETLVLSPAMSLSLDLPDSRYEMLELTGAWARERYINTQPLHPGIQAVSSLRGHSSHQFNPFIALKRPETTEDSGEVLGFSLVYSGNFLAQVEVDPFGVSRVQLGIHPREFSWKLLPNTEFQTPEAIMVYSDHGLNGMSQSFHTLFRTRLCRGYWRDRERPILLNSWEAMYMKFDEEKILDLAREAAPLGIELLVMDDGWFGHRDDDHTSLGDWFPYEKKLPRGLSELSERVEALGMKFGLWVEPEMVSEDSELYRAHSDWVIGVPGRNRCHGRNQFVLDFSRPEVVSYIGDSLAAVFRSAKISYVKWDMNRSITEPYSRTLDHQGEFFHRHMLGVYALWERLTAEFPEILFESCASGGARFDPGMLYYAPQVWTSDNTDAAERLRIQYGTSVAYPLSVMGCHVSASPNHQTGRSTSLETRGNTAYFGNFGYELDIGALTEAEKAEIRDQIAFMKAHRKLFSTGTFYRLKSPFQGTETAWMVVNSEKTEAMVGFYRERQPANAPYSRLPLRGLDPDRLYRISDRPDPHYGDELTEIGLILSDQACGVYGKSIPQGDHQSRLFHLTAE